MKTRRYSDDACCGTERYQLAYYSKKNGVKPDEIINVFGHQTNILSIQLSTLTLAKPDNINQSVKHFRKDAIELYGQIYSRPKQWKRYYKIFPTIDYVVSNLPFIKSKEIEVLSPNRNKQLHSR